MKVIKWIILIFALFVVVCEFVLRYAFGFCDALLYRESDKYEYIAQANQNRHRFGAYIHYNSFSQRNGEPDSAKVRVLGLGDSVLFGGTWMDQDSLASTLFSNETGMQMLNISAGSWGPDNCAAYLKEKGTFGASAMILVCSSHDAYDVMSHMPVVGIYPNYPDKQYSLAWIELIDRYLMPKVKMFFVKKTFLDPDASAVASAKGKYVIKKSMKFNPGFSQLKTMADSLHIPFSIYLHAEKGELEAGKYNEMGEMIIKWTRQNNVPLMQGLKNGETLDMYRDIIHFNEKGQRHLASCLESIIKKKG